MRNSALDETLLKSAYSQPALVPACPWLRSHPSRQANPYLASQTSNQSSQLKMSWFTGGGRASWLWALQWQDRNGKRDLPIRKPPFMERPAPDW